jgi:hypothetical protein
MNSEYLAVEWPVRLGWLTQMKELVNLHALGSALALPIHSLPRIKIPFFFSDSRPIRNTQH